jgi:hypothetical protein
MTLQKMGGVSALIEALTFLFGIVLAVTLLAPYTGGNLDPVQEVGFLADNQAILYLWNQIIYVVFGVFLVVLSLALHERLKDGSPALAQTATAFGLIWAGLVIASGMVFNIGLKNAVELYSTDPALAASVWLPVTVIQDGLGGGNEIVGGVWVLLLSWAALRTGGLPRALNYLGVVISVVGIITIIPPLTELGAVFGLGSIIWFAWAGIVMLRGRSDAAA